MLSDISRSVILQPQYFWSTAVDLAYTAVSSVFGIAMEPHADSVFEPHFSVTWQNYHCTYECNKIFTIKQRKEAVHDFFSALKVHRAIVVEDIRTFFHEIQKTSCTYSSTTSPWLYEYHASLYIYIQQPRETRRKRRVNKENKEK